MKLSSRTMCLVALVLATTLSAMAGEIRWTFKDVAFTNGNVLKGYFDTNSTATAIDDFSITITGPASEAVFTPTQMSSDYLVSNTVGMADDGWVHYADLYLTSALTSAGGRIPFSSGYDCNGCGVLLVDSRHQPSVNGAAVPEPSAVLLLGSGLGMLGVLKRRWI